MRKDRSFFTYCIHGLPDGKNCKVCDDLHKPKQIERFNPTEDCLSDCYKNGKHSVLCRRFDGR